MTQSENLISFGHVDLQMVTSVCVARFRLEESLALKVNRPNLNHEFPKVFSDQESFESINSVL